MSKKASGIAEEKREGPGPAPFLETDPGCPILSSPGAFPLRPPFDALAGTPRIHEVEPADSQGTAGWRVVVLIESAAGVERIEVFVPEEPSWPSGGGQEFRC